MSFLSATTRNLFGSLSLQVRELVFGWVFRVNLLGQAYESVQEETDEDLVKKLRKGDDQAFDQLYERYFGPIFSFTMKRVGHYQTAEDLVSKVFMKAFGARKRLEINTTFKAWIYTIACNAITDHYRTNKKEEQVENHEAKVVVEGGETPKILDVEITRRMLEKVLRTLDSRGRQVLTMKFFGQMSNKEIAEVLGVSASHVGVMVFRALKQCKGHIPDEFLS
jgi:RNA polymerase sigma-70 factor, ECF subfamily